MAMRALLRSAAARSRGSRPVAAADACSLISREYRSDVAASAIPCSCPYSLASSRVSQLPKSPRIPSRIVPASHSVSALLHSFSLSSYSLSSASGAPRIPSQVSSFLISAPSVAPLSVLSAGLRRSLADLRVSNVYEGQQLGGASSIVASMQQKRNLSKLKKYKIKSYSSYKERFRLMADGTYKRWRSGTRHNAHSKTAKQRRQLRRPSIAPAALAKVMKKLNFVL